MTLALLLGLLAGAAPAQGGPTTATLLYTLGDPVALARGANGRIRGYSSPRSLLDLSPEGDAALLLVAYPPQNQQPKPKVTMLTRGYLVDAAAPGAAVRSFFVCESNGVVEVQQEACPLPQSFDVRTAKLVARDRLVLFTTTFGAGSQTAATLVDLGTRTALSRAVVQGPIGDRVLWAGAGRVWTVTDEEAVLVDLANGRTLQTVTLPPAPESGFDEAYQRFFGARGDELTLVDTRGTLCSFKGKRRNCSRPLAGLARFEKTPESNSRRQISEITGLAANAGWAVVWDSEKRLTRLVEVATLRTAWTENPLESREFGRAGYLLSVAVATNGRMVLERVFDDSDDVELQLVGPTGRGTYDDVAAGRLHRGTVTSLKFTGADSLLSGDASGALVSWDLRAREGRRFEPPWEVGTVSAMALDATGDPVTLHGLTTGEGLSIPQHEATAVLRWSLREKKATTTALVTPPLPVPFWATSYICAGAGGAEPGVCAAKQKMAGSQSREAEVWRQQQKCRTTQPGRLLKRQAPPLAHVGLAVGKGPLDWLSSTLWLSADAKRLVTWDSHASEEGYFAKPAIVELGKCVETAELEASFACSTRWAQARGPVLYRGDRIEFLDEALAVEAVLAAPENAWGCDVDRNGGLSVSLEAAVASWPSRTGEESRVSAEKGARARRRLDGGAFAELNADGRLWLRQGTGEAVAAFDFASVGDVATAFEVSPDQKRIAVGTWGGRVFVFGVE
ncbi:MAG: hypothetical protein QM765_28405 [Myxococcales bacterium]